MVETIDVRPFESESSTRKGDSIKSLSNIEASDLIQYRVLQGRDDSWHDPSRDPNDRQVVSGSNPSNGDDDDTCDERHILPPIASSFSDEGRDNVKIPNNSRILDDFLFLEGDNSKLSEIASDNELVSRQIDCSTGQSEGFQFEAETVIVESQEGTFIEIILRQDCDHIQIETISEINDGPCWNVDPLPLLPPLANIDGEVAATDTAVEYSKCIQRQAIFVDEDSFEDVHSQGEVDFDVGVGVDVDEEPYLLKKCPSIQEEAETSTVVGRCFADDDREDDVTIRGGQQNVLLVSSSLEDRYAGDDDDNVRQPPTSSGYDDGERGCHDKDPIFFPEDNHCLSTAPPDALFRDVATFVYGAPQGNCFLALRALDQLHRWSLEVEEDHILEQFIARNTAVDTLLDFLYGHVHNGLCVDKTIKVLQNFIYVDNALLGREQLATEIAVNIFEHHGIGILVQTLDVHQNASSSHYSTRIFKTSWSILMDVIHDDDVAGKFKSWEYRGLVLHAVHLCLDRMGDGTSVGSTYVSTSSATTMFQILTTIRTLIEDDDKADSPTRLVSAGKRIIPKCLEILLGNDASISSNESLWEEAITLCLKCVSSHPDDTLSQALVSNTTTSVLAPFVTKAIRTFPGNGVIQGTSCLLEQKGCNCRSFQPDDCTAQDPFSSVVSFLALSIRKLFAAA
jgi:hypothetical protein